eukprot:4307170-Prymnesium_polylepis.1
MSGVCDADAVTVSGRDGVVTLTRHRRNSASHIFAAQKNHSHQSQIKTMEISLRQALAPCHHIVQYRNPRTKWNESDSYGSVTRSTSGTSRYTCMAAHGEMYSTPRCGTFPSKRTMSPTHTSFASSRRVSILGTMPISSSLPLSSGTHAVRGFRTKSGAKGGKSTCHLPLRHCASRTSPVTPPTDRPSISPNVHSVACTQDTIGHCPDGVIGTPRRLPSGAAAEPFTMANDEASRASGYSRVAVCAHTCTSNAERTMCTPGRSCSIFTSQGR